MKITSIRIRTLKNTNKMVGVASITLENMIAIHDIKILKSVDGLFLAMPSKSVKSGNFKDIVHPINASVRGAIEAIVFEAYTLCINNDYISAQFDVIKEFQDSIIKQTFKEFELITNEEGNHLLKNKDISKSPKKCRNAFLDWLNN